MVFTFVERNLSGAPGATLRFFARLNNTSGAPITLQGFNPGLTAPGLSINDLFFNNVPDPLPVGPGPIAGYNVFNVVISPTAAAGTYAGSSRIDFDTSTTPGLSVTQGFSVRVVSSNVPEPGVCAFLAAGSLSGVVLLWRRGRARGLPLP